MSNFGSLIVKIIMESSADVNVEVPETSELPVDAPINSIVVPSNVNDILNVVTDNTDAAASVTGNANELETSTGTSTSFADKPDFRDNQVSFELLVHFFFS